MMMFRLSILDGIFDHVFGGWEIHYGIYGPPEHPIISRVIELHKKIAVEKNIPSYPSKYGFFFTGAPELPPFITILGAHGYNPSYALDKLTAGT